MPIGRRQVKTQVLKHFNKVSQGEMFGDRKLQKTGSNAREVNLARRVFVRVCVQAGLPEEKIGKTLAGLSERQVKEAFEEFSVQDIQENALDIYIQICEELGLSAR